MVDNCNECKPAVMCANFKEELNSLKKEVTDIKEKVSKLETSTAVNEEQTKMVFKILTEIKDSIKGIADKIEKIETKPGATWDKIKLVIITAMCTGMVSFILSKILK